jgi:hypothetical protein
MAVDFKREAQYGMARPGLGSVGSYQVAGHPFLKVLASPDDLDSETAVSFPTVTRSILIKNTTDIAIKIHFATEAGSVEAITNKHYWTLENKYDSIEMKVKCTKIYITPAAVNGGCEIFAELTNIPATDMYDLDRENLTGISA